MATQSNDYVGGVGPGGIQVWRPSPYLIGSAQNPAAQVPSAGGGGTPTGGSTDSNGNQYASALFIAATCQSSDQVGACVRADSGANAVVTDTAFLPYPAIGVIVSKSSATNCVVQTYGLCSVLSGLTANSRYFVGGDGQPCLATNIPSNAPYVQPVGFAVGASSFFVQPSGIMYRRDTSSAPASGTGDTVQAFSGSLLHGTGAPDASVGNQDDFWLQTDGATGPVLWGPKDANSGWPSTGVALVGPPGQGNRFFWGDGAPSDSLAPSTNDAYFDRTNGALYQAS